MQKMKFNDLTFREHFEGQGYTLRKSCGGTNLAVF